MRRGQEDGRFLHEDVPCGHETVTQPVTARSFRPSFFFLKNNFLLLSRSVVSDSWRPRGRQHARPPVLEHLLEFAETHVPRVSGAIQPSHPLPPPSPFAFSLSQLQGLSQGVGFKLSTCRAGAGWGAPLCLGSCLAAGLALGPPRGHRGLWQPSAA